MDLTKISDPVIKDTLESLYTIEDSELMECMLVIDISSVIPRSNRRRYFALYDFVAGIHKISL